MISSSFFFCYIEQTILGEGIVDGYHLLRPICKICIHLVVFCKFYLQKDERTLIFIVRRGVSYKKMSISGLEFLSQGGSSSCL